MKNPELCRKCFFKSVLGTLSGEIIGTTCGLPMSVYIANEQKGLHKNDTDNTCYEFLDKEDKNNLQI